MVINSKKTDSKKTDSKKETKIKKPKKEVIKKPKKEVILKVFCGITDPIPKGYRLGSMKECVDKNQVRYYGLKKIDSLVIKSINKKKEDYADLQVQAAGLKGTISKIKRDFNKTTDLNEKKKLLEEFENNKKKLLNIGEKLLDLKESKS
jgi:hypothetical protein